MAALTSLQSAARRFFVESSGNMLIMGQPGCGKSFLLKELQNVCESKKLTHDTLAMRGHNAHDVGGSTIHSRIVPLPHNKSICKTSAELRGCLWLALGGSLGGYADDWKVVARDDYWKRLDVLFIDEVFLVDAGMFALTDLYARRIRGVDSSFGGIRVCVLGDSFQMAPRGDGAVHVFRPVPLGSPPASAWIPSDSDEEEEEKPIGEKYIISSPETPAIENTELRPWDDAAFTPFRLTENKRQEGSDQGVFREVLAAIATGKSVRDMPEEHKNLLKSICVADVPDDTYALFWSREDAAKRNEKCNDLVQGTILAELETTIKATGPATAKLNAMRVAFVADLPLEGKVVIVKAGGPLMLLSNLDLASGAYRGAIGTVSEVVRENGWITGVMLDLAGTQFLVEPREETLVDGDSSCAISYWPLGYGFAGTYDSAQGKTIAKLAIAITPRMPAGMLNVGVSRVRRHQDLRIFANVNKYNDVADAWKILQIPNLTKVDAHSAAFSERIREQMGHAVLDEDIFDNLKQTTKRKRESPIEIEGCATCGAAPELVFSCGHMVSCAECWAAARRAGAATCIRCGVPVTRSMHVRVQA